MEYDDAPAPELNCARLLACGRIETDLSNPDDGYSLHNVLVHARPADGLGFPFRLKRMFLFAQLHGTSGDWLLRVRLVRIGVEDGEEFEHERAVEFGPWEIEMPEDGNYVECIGIPLGNVPFREPGVFEFQLWADGLDMMLYNERVEARE